MTKKDDLSAILAWFTEPRPDNPSDQLPFLKAHLAALQRNEIQGVERFIVLRNLVLRGMEVIRALLPKTVVRSLPIPKKTRQMVQDMQEILSALSEELVRSLPVNDSGWIDNPLPVHEWSLYQIVCALSTHIRLSLLTSSPVAPGLWQQLHRVYEIAFLSNVAKNTLKNATDNLHDIYCATVLLGCVQPASFTSKEIHFIASYFEQFANQVHLTLVDNAAETPSVFWIDPKADTPAFAFTRKQPLPHSGIYYFSCFLLASLIQRHLELLDAGEGGLEKIGLPRQLTATVATSVLRRLAEHIGNPTKRRFARRSQKNYRVTLCTQFGNVWPLFQQESTPPSDPSLWMVINESPDGLAMMHVSGETENITVGDIAAICREDGGGGWLIGLVCWAVSANPENIEIGVQILSPRAQSAHVILSGKNKGKIHLPVILLPKLPNLHDEMLIAPLGLLEKHDGNIVLMLEEENLVVREVKKTERYQQNGLIEIFSIATQQPTPDPPKKP